MRNHLILLIFLMISFSLSSPDSLLQIDNDDSPPVLSSHLKILQGNSVTDTTPPLIISPVDVSYVVNSTGNTIVWYIADSNPSNYSILYNYQYNEADRNVSWTENKTVSINVDSLPIGLHIFTINAEDTWGNRKSNHVPVTVIEATKVVTFSLTTTDPIDLSLLFDFLSTIGISIIGITLLVWIFITSNRYRKRRSLVSSLPPIDPLDLELPHEDEY